MINKNTLLKNIYSNTPLEKYSKYFYYGFGEEWKNLTIGSLNSNVWRNNASIRAMNRCLKLYNDGFMNFIFINKNKPDVNLIFIKQNKTSKLAIVLAGGGFESVANSIEALPVAMKLYDKGFAVAVLTYSIKENAKGNSSYEDLLCAIDYLSHNRNNLNIDMNNFLLGGLSAGAYLAAKYGTSNYGYMKQNMPKPGAIFLAYPVITMGRYAHKKSKLILLGEKPNNTLIKEYSIETNVSKEYPPVYIWQCKYDSIVSINNSKLLVAQLKAKHIPYIYRVFNSDAHGWGAADNTPARRWVNQMVNFYEKQ